MALTLAPFWERLPSLTVLLVGVYFTPNDASGSPPLKAASLGRVITASDRVRFALFCRGWKTTTPDEGFDSLYFLDTQGKGTNMVHETSFPGVGCAGNDACPRLTLSAKGLSLS